MIERVHAGRPVARVTAELEISRANGHKWVRCYDDRRSARSLQQATPPPGLVSRAGLSRRFIQLRRTGAWARPASARSSTCTPRRCTGS
ncbi:hypothetical protein [Amycolatopsis sp. FDAARGOS 1241]|uniref:hypothetical protein n=1 Tax=Amycolatopsis sp. FDAARGOS 1241 TaxID=2778070 RepID=UPI00194E8B0D|nr:hypothetical protein I6J71_47190 [Amycolatopsis sp. FDAARGOS 1241]